MWRTISYSRTSNFWENRFSAIISAVSHSMRLAWWQHGIMAQVRLFRSSMHHHDGRSTKFSLWWNTIQEAGLLIICQITSRSIQNSPNHFDPFLRLSLICVHLVIIFHNFESGEYRSTLQLWRFRHIAPLRIERIIKMFNSLISF